MDRLYLREADGGRIIVEVTLGEDGLCPSQGRSVHARGEPSDAVVDAVCERVASRGAVVAAPEESSPWKLGARPLSAGGALLRLVLAAIAALGAGLALRGPRVLGEPALLFVGAALVRALREPVPFVGPDAAFEVMALALGEQADHALYGGGFGALHALGQVAGPSLGGLWATQLALGALAPPLVWALLRALVPESPWAARFGGLAMGALPLHVVLSASEVPHVGLVAVELLAAVAIALVARPDSLVGRADPGVGPASVPAALLAGLAAGFAAHVRPEAIPVSLVLLGLLASRRTAAAWAGAGLGAALVAWRVASLPSDGAEPANLGQLASPDVLSALLRPALTLDPHRSLGGAWNASLHAGLTPLVLPTIAAWGLWRDPRRAGPVLLVVLAALLPVLNKSWPNADAWRLQLPALAGAVVLAGLGAAALPRRALGGALALQLAWSAVLVPRIAAGWTTHAAWHWLREQPPVASTLLFPDHSTHGQAAGQVLQLLAPEARVTPLSLFLAAPGGDEERFAWLGPTCALAELPGERVPAADPCGQLRDRCDLTPVAEVALPARGDLDLVLRSDPVLIGIYRVGACR